MKKKQRYGNKKKKCKIKQVIKTPIKGDELFIAKHFKCQTMSL